MCFSRTAISNTESTAEAAANSQAEQSSKAIDQNQNNKREEIWHCMATVNTGIAHFFVVTVNAKHPNAAHNHPHELECDEEAVTTAATAGDKGGQGALFVVIF